MAIGDDILLQRLEKREAELWGQAASLDLKASVFLAVIAFLAQQSTTILGWRPPCLGHAAVMFAIVAQVVAATACAVVIAVRNYNNEESEIFIPWRDDRIKNYSEHNASLEDDLKDKLLRSTLERIALNTKLNNMKATAAVVGFCALLVAFVLNGLVSLHLL
jgi:hypothetical protein